MFGLWYLRALSTIFSYIVMVSFIGGGNRKYPEKTTNLSQITDKLDHIMMFRVSLSMTAIRTHNFDWTGS